MQNKRKGMLMIAQPDDLKSHERGDGSAALDATPAREGRVSYAAVIAATLSHVEVGAPGFSVLDGVELSAGSPILLVGQANASESGVWMWHAADAPLARPCRPN